MIERCIPRIYSTNDLILTLVEELNSDAAANFVAMLWQILKERNSLLWESRSRPPTAAVLVALTELSDWAQVQQITGKGPRTSHCLAWHRPTANMSKVNVDAAFFDDSKQIGFGMVLRDDKGDFFAAQTVVYHCIMDVDIGKAMGFMEALSWVKNCGLQNVMIEGDAKIVVDVIRLGLDGVSGFNDVISACIS
ncbi:hypothetical protein ACS0TY_006481 [Phlomoides rotata]